MGVLDMRVNCYRPMGGQVRIAQAGRVLRESPQKLGSPQPSSETLISSEAQMNILEQLVQVLREPRGEAARKQMLAFPKLCYGLFSYFVVISVIWKWMYGNSLNCVGMRIFLVKCQYVIYVSLEDILSAT